MGPETAECLTGMPRRVHWRQDSLIPHRGKFDFNCSALARIRVPGSQAALKVMKQQTFRSSGATPRRVGQLHDGFFFLITLAVSLVPDTKTSGWKPFECGQGREELRDNWNPGSTTGRAGFSIGTGRFDGVTTFSR